jgi:hypothetical protein
MISVRDRMFGDLVKRVASWELPVLSIAYLAQRSWGEAIAAFIGALSPAIPTLVDYLVDVRKFCRTNALAYLIEAVPSGSVPLGDKSGV